MGLTPERARAVVQALSQVSCEGKVIWMIDAPTRAMLVEWLAVDANLAGRLCVVQDDSLRRAEVRARMDAARVLCREVSSLPEQISLLHGAHGAVLDVGHALADVADLLAVPYASLDSTSAQVMRGQAGGAAIDVRVLDGDALNAVLDESRMATAETPVLAQPAPSSGAAIGIAEHLFGWIDAREQAAMAV
jgi:hypothetical protein